MYEIQWKSDVWWHACWTRWKILWQSIPQKIKLCVLKTPIILRPFNDFVTISVFLLLFYFSVSTFARQSLTSIVVQLHCKFSKKWKRISILLADTEQFIAFKSTFLVTKSCIVGWKCIEFILLRFSLVKNDSFKCFSVIFLSFLCIFRCMCFCVIKI